MAHNVKCRICGRTFDTDEGIEGLDWIRPSRNYYYHRECYDNWYLKKQKDSTETAAADESLWFETMGYYLERDLKIKIDETKVDSQWKNLIRKGRTPKGIYFALRYYYDIMHGDVSKALGGIGIVDYVYADSVNYWTQKHFKDQELIAAVKEQSEKQAAQEKIVVKSAKPERKQKYELEAWD